MAHLQIRNLTDGFGSEVTGLNPRIDFDVKTRAMLRELFYERGALLFPEIDIDLQSQDRFCRMLLGDDEPPTAIGNPMYVSNKEEGGYAPYGRLMFHADMMWHEKPFQVLSLYAVNVEAGSATTSLASGAYAWATLPNELRTRLEGRRAVHITGTVYHRGGDDLLRSEREQETSTEKPILHTHPRTGKPILYVSQQTTREVVGMPPDESEELLQEAFAHLYGVGKVYEHTWRNGDLLVFDNVAVQHARGNVNVNGPTRTLRKVVAPIPNVRLEAPKFAKMG